ncbi:arginine--tRNA ligase [Candidatus Chlorohelix sp.]|uniref:arginine--tRNA ligase n=1 Tax=Candidatus Chlorohelix sp. TaxID=3139201 RepID=UPI00305DB9D4
MEYALERLRVQCAELLAATGLVKADAVTLTDPKPNIPADLAFPCFQAARAAGINNPAEFAAKLAAAVQIPADSLIGKVEAAGPFVNFSVNPSNFTTETLSEALKLGEDYGKGDSGTGQTLTIDFSSPNIARKMHVGHLRSTVIGNSIRNILKFLGYNVIADNHLGDWGTQFGSLLAAHDLWGWSEKINENPIEELVEIYARFHKASEEDPKLRDLARDWFRRLEEGDVKARELWKWMVDITLLEFAKTYARLGVTFDLQHGESFYEPMLDEVVQEAQDKGIAKVEPSGAISVGFDEKLPSYLLRKQDGATLYQTRDIATCIYRWREYQPDRNIYVVGQEQKLHFQQVFETVRLMGYTEIAERSVHIPFGKITDAQGQRFSMRRGTAIFLDEVLDEALERARAVIAEKITEGKTDLTADEQEYASQIISVGAVIFNDLYQDPGRDIRFDWDKMLAFDGNSAPYIQYTHARCCSILRKAEELPQDANYTLLSSVEEQAVVKQLARFPQVVKRAGLEFLPAVIAEWTYGLAREFARFYHEISVLEAPTPELRAARLGLVAAVATNLRNGLALLGIKAPERM